MHQEVHVPDFGGNAVEAPETERGMFSCQPRPSNVGLRMTNERMSPSVRRVAQANLSAVLQAMAELTQKVVADRIGVADGTLSTMKSEHLARFTDLVAACNLRIVAVSDELIPAHEVRAMRTLLAASMKRDLERNEDKESE